MTVWFVYKIWQNYSLLQNVTESNQLTSQKKTSRTELNLSQLLKTHTKPVFILPIMNSFNKIETVIFPMHDMLHKTGCFITNDEQLQ